MRYLNEFEEFDPNDFEDFGKDIDDVQELGFSLKPTFKKDYGFNLDLQGTNDGKSVLYMNKFAADFLQDSLMKDFGRKNMSSWNSGFVDKKNDHFPNFRGIEGIRPRGSKWGPSSVNAYIHGPASTLNTLLRYYVDTTREKYKDLSYINLISDNRKFPGDPKYPTQPLGVDRIKRMYDGILKYIEEKTKL